MLVSSIAILKGVVTFPFVVNIKFSPALFSYVFRTFPLVFFNLTVPAAK